jgi:hypothetical protein
LPLKQQNAAWRCLPQHGHVEALIKNASRPRCLAIEAHGHCVGPVKNLRERQAGRDSESRPEDPLAARYPEVRPSHMHVATEAIVGAAPLHESVERDFAQRHALGEKMTVAAMGVDHLIIPPQRSDGGNHEGSRP